MGVRYIHSRKIIHLDLKPENILLHVDSGGNVEVKIADFGISRSTMDKGEIEFDGDRLYMAPELLDNRCSLSSDVYSLGLIFIEVTFEIPVALKSVTMKRHLRNERCELSKKDRGLRNFYEFMKKMVDEDEEMRPKISEVLTSIRKYRTAEKRKEGAARIRNPKVAQPKILHPAKDVGI